MGENGGIYSLAGFAYQMKVFILQILEIKSGCTLEYETIDDVALKMTADDMDEHEDELCSILGATNRKAIQVKKTQVTKSIVKKVVKNWILADKKHHDIENFILVTDREISTDILVDLDVNEICEEVKIATGNKSIDAKVKLIGYTESELIQKIKDIVSKASIHKYEDIDTEIIEGFKDYFIRAAVTEPTYILRIKQLIQQVTVEITDDKWEPRFSEFRKLKKVNLSDLAIIKSREYLQLIESTSLTSADISRHLQYAAEESAAFMFYKNFALQYIHFASW